MCTSCVEAGVDVDVIEVVEELLGCGESMAKQEVVDSSNLLVTLRTKGGSRGFSLFRESWCPMEPSHFQRVLVDADAGGINPNVVTRASRSLTSCTNAEM